MSRELYIEHKCKIDKKDMRLENLSEINCELPPKLLGPRRLIPAPILAPTNEKNPCYLVRDAAYRPCNGSYAS